MILSTMICLFKSGARNEGKTLGAASLEIFLPFARPGMNLPIVCRPESQSHPLIAPPLFFSTSFSEIESGGELWPFVRVYAGAVFVRLLCNQREVSTAFSALHVSQYGSSE